MYLHQNLSVKDLQPNRVLFGSFGHQMEFRLVPNQSVWRNYNPTSVRFSVIAREIFLSVPSTVGNVRPSINVSEMNGCEYY